MLSKTSITFTYHYAYTFPERDNRLGGFVIS